jgi:FKBP-type peptidyl-prolyl cis-trans isomerase FklB
MRLIALTSVALLTACTSAPAERPMPADPTDPASIVAAARQCNAADFDAVDIPDIGRPEFSGDPSEADRNQLEGDIYLERTSFQPCVYALPSGLHFRVLRSADDAALTPEGGEYVRVHYDGQSIEGDTFDSSYDRGAPAEFPSDRLIRGWVEALGHMRTGEEWELFIPADLAYGARGTPGGPIGPNQALYFRMELICLPGREDGGCED